MSSSTLSDTSTIYSRCPDTRPDTPESFDEIDKDHPVAFDAFLRNVKRCKLVLGLASPIAFGLEIAHFLLWDAEDWTGAERTVLEIRRWTDVAGMIITVSRIAEFRS